MACVFRIVDTAAPFDIRLLRPTDRAALRVLDRAEAATPRQLATLIYSDLRTAQQRLAALWQAGLLERMLLPPRHRGGAQLVYRLSRRARMRLGDTSSRRRGSNRIAHTLDIVETVCSLAAAEGDIRHRSPVQLWLTEPMAAQVVEGPPYADSIVVLSTADQSALLCVEVDRGTQRLGAIRAKLAGYGRLAQQRPDWQLLIVVPHEIRARWFVSLAADDLPTIPASVVVLPTLTSHGLRAPLLRLDRPSVGGAVIADLLVAGERRSEYPVGTRRWIELLGEGGTEDLEDLPL